MKSIKIFTVAEVEWHDADEPVTTCWNRAFASREEAEAMVEENAIDRWTEAVGDGMEEGKFPGVSKEDGDIWFVVGDVRIGYIVTEVDLDLP